MDEKEDGKVRSEGQAAYPCFVNKTWVFTAV